VTVVLFLFTKQGIKIKTELLKNAQAAVIIFVTQYSFEIILSEIFCEASSKAVISNDVSDTAVFF